MSLSPYSGSNPTQRPSESYATYFWGMALGSMGFPGLTGEVIADQNSQSTSLRERICLRFMGLTTVPAIPAFLLGSGVLVIAEKIFGRRDRLDELKTNTEQSGQALKEQEQIIEEFRPLLKLLSDQVIETSEKTEQKTAEVKENTQALDALAVDYPPNADSLEKIKDLITRLEIDLPIQLSSLSRPQEQTLALRIAMLKKIEEKKQKMKENAALLSDLFTQARKYAEEVDLLLAQASARTAIKEVQIASLEKSVESVVIPKPMQEVSHGSPIEDILA